MVSTISYSRRRQVYEGLPAILKAPVRWVPFSLVAGRGYRRTLARGPVMDASTRSELRAWQETALGDILAFATDQVPAYRAMRSAVARLSPFEALRAFPLVPREALENDVGSFLPRDFEAIPHYACSTGGTTGKQLELFMDNDSQSVEMGFMHRQWARVGYTPRQRKATFRGVSFPNLRPGRYWQDNPVYNELQFSPFHINEQTLGAYFDRLCKFRPRYLHGYPSAIATLAAFVLRHGLDGRRLGVRAALLGSEGPEPGQRELIERAFATRAFSWYGHSERVLLGGECEHTTAYHQFPDYGILEIVRDLDGEPAPEGESGELVGTGLFNRCLPLVRYRTGDRARRLDSRCPCGRSFDRFDQVEGIRKQEYVVGVHGSRMTLAALNMHGDLFSQVVRYQYYQDRPGRVEVRLTVTPLFGEAELQALARGFRAKVGDELEVRLSIVEEIPLTVRGKLRRLVQAIPTENADLPRDQHSEA